MVGVGKYVSMISSHFFRSQQKLVLVEGGVIGGVAINKTQNPLYKPCSCLDSGAGKRRHEDESAARGAAPA